MCVCVIVGCQNDGREREDPAVTEVRTRLRHAQQVASIAQREVLQLRQRAQAAESALAASRKTVASLQARNRDLEEQLARSMASQQRRSQSQTASSTQQNEESSTAQDARQEAGQEAGQEGSSSSSDDHSPDAGSARQGRSSEQRTPTSVISSFPTSPINTATSSVQRDRRARRSSPLSLSTSFLKDIPTTP